MTPSDTLTLAKRYAREAFERDLADTASGSVLALFKENYLDAFPSPLMHATHAEMAQRGDLIASMYTDNGRACLVGSVYGDNGSYFSDGRWNQLLDLWQGDREALTTVDNAWTEFIETIIEDVKTRVAEEYLADRLNGDLHYRDEPALEGYIGSLFLPKVHEAVGVTVDA